VCERESKCAREIASERVGAREGACVCARQRWWRKGAERAGAGQVCKERGGQMGLGFDESCIVNVSCSCGRLEWACGEWCVQELTNGDRHVKPTVMGT